MAHIRIIHPKHYDRKRNRFTSLALRPSSNGGVSTIDPDCVSELEKSICGHIREYYTGIHGDPIIFCILDQTFYAGCEIGTEPSGSGDICHRDIFDKLLKDCKRYIKSKSADEFYICDEDSNEGRILNENDIVAFN